MLQDGYLGGCLNGGVRVRWVCNKCLLFCNFHRSPSDLSAMCRPQHRVSIWGTIMAGKATAGAPACERATTTFNKQHCQHITVSGVVEKECDGGCKWDASGVWAWCDDNGKLQIHISSQLGLYCNCGACFHPGVPHTPRCAAAFLQVQVQVSLAVAAIVFQSSKKRVKVKSVFFPHNCKCLPFI